MSVYIMPDETSIPKEIELLSADRLILATNRGPVEHVINHNQALIQQRAPGGVVTALLHAGSHMKMTWVAMAMTEGDRLAVKNAQLHGRFLRSPLLGRQVDLRYLVIPKSTYCQYYEQISNRVLWFLQHYLCNPDEPCRLVPLILEAWDDGYCTANQIMAEAVCAEIEREHSKAVVMLHDYHLYLVASLIRQRHPSVPIQQFIHIPWPAVRYWQSFLPNALTVAIYRGLLGNDLVGFQTEQDARNFLEGARTLLPAADVDSYDGAVIWQNHRTLVRAYPISISVTEERQIVRSVAGKQAAERIRPLLGKQTILRVDRIDPSKNIIQGFYAYQHLLATHPELHEKVTFLAFLVPSRQNVQLYQQYKAQVLKLIEDINEHYGSSTWTPIHAFIENDRTQALAAMQFYDVLLVNPHMDGMNLVAKEGAVINHRHGVLVLSRTAGVFQQLREASIPTSPTDVIEIATALYQALTLPLKERRLKAKLARQIVERDNLDAWMTSQVSDLNRVIADRATTELRQTDDLVALHYLR